jgi:LETM1 and EF-hand domain-containing protein 1
LEIRTLEELAKEQKRIAAKRNTETPDNTIAVKQEESAASMLEFLEKARNGEMVPPDVIVQYANFFKDDLTLDNMPRMQLINMCRYMSIPPYGADSFLRFQLRHKIRTLKEDDQRILWEGIDSLTKMELREACQERGMRSTGMSKEAYKRSLQQWLDLSVNKNVPISLLIMSRIFFLQEELLTSSTDDDTKSVAGLADAISGLDKDVWNEVILEVATSEEKKSNPDVRKIRLEVLTHQNEKIREEQAEREAATKKKESSNKGRS